MGNPHKKGVGGDRSQRKRAREGGQRKRSLVQAKGGRTFKGWMVYRVRCGKERDQKNKNDGKVNRFDK